MPFAVIRLDRCLANDNYSISALEQIYLFNWRPETGYSMCIIYQLHQYEYSKAIDGERNKQIMFSDLYLGSCYFLVLVR